MTSCSTMSSRATAKAEAAPIWGQEDDTLTDEPIGAIAAMPTATVMSRAGVRDPSPTTTSGASGAVRPAVAPLPGVRAPPICATVGHAPWHSHVPDQPRG
jgi:hypothetical protein